MADKKKGEIAVARFQMISPLIVLSLDPPGFRKMRSDIAAEHDLSERTIDRYLARYKAEGIDGLKPRNPGRPGAEAITPEIMREAIVLRRENPNRGVNKIIRCLELEEIAEEGTIKRSTLQDRLYKEGYGREEMKVRANNPQSGGYRFQHKHRNSLWQADTKHGPFIGKKTFLTSFIDDCTRYIVHSEFYYNDNTDTLLDCYQKAVIKRGTPKEVYFDRGPNFASKALDRCCSVLEVRRRLAKARTPRSKGKIEKFHQVVDKFIGEDKLNPSESLAELNEKWQCYLEVFYQRMNHSALDPGTTPRDAYNNDKTELRLVSKETIDSAFLLFAKRRVDKSGCVDFDGKKYTAPGLLTHMLKKVNVVWKPCDKTKIWAEVGENTRLELEVLQQKKWAPKRPEMPEQSQWLKTESSRFLAAAEKENKKIEAAKASAYDGIKPEDQTENMQAFKDLYTQLQQDSKVKVDIGGNAISQSASVTDADAAKKEIDVKEQRPEGGQPTSSPGHGGEATKRRSISYKSLPKGVSND